MDVRQRMHHELSQNPYILGGIRQLIDNTLSYITFASKNIELRVIGDVTTMDTVTCRKLCKRVSCIQSMYPTNPSKLIVWIFLNDEKRVMPEQGEVVKQKHINGGYTYLNGNEIFVLRREEYPKVVLHETLHHTSHHMHQWDSSDLKRLYNAFHISYDQCAHSMHSCNTDLAPNEAIIECWAEMFHIAFLSIEYNLPFKKLYETELSFAFAQACKVLQYQRRHHPVWKETTHAYSYMVLRTMLLYTFASWYRNRQTSGSLTTLMIATFNNPHVQEKLRGSSPTSKTLRMTLFGDF